MNIDEMKDRIARAEEIQRYTENRCGVLEKENAELKAIVRNTKAVDESFTKLQQENKVLAQNLEDTEIVNKALEKENAELKSENQKWKDEWQEQVQKATDEGYARTLQTMQLTKAKELLKNILAISVHDKRQCTYDAYILTVKEAEQFLKDSEVEK